MCTATLAAVSLTVIGRVLLWIAAGLSVGIGALAFVLAFEGPADPCPAVTEGPPAPDPATRAQWLADAGLTGPVPACREAAARCAVATSGQT
jgi:hypothetical protein